MEGGALALQPGTGGPGIGAEDLGDQSVEVRAVASRPVEQFTTSVAAPDWEAEGDNQIWYAPPNDEPLVDPDGNPIDPNQPPDDTPQDRPDQALAPKDEDAPSDRLDQQWLDRTIDRPTPRERAVPRESQR